MTLISKPKIFQDKITTDKYLSWAQMQKSLKYISKSNPKIKNISQPSQVYPQRKSIYILKSM